jgi:hypothetical protein
MLSLSEKADNPCNDTRSLPTKILPMHCYIAISNAPPGHRSSPFSMLVIEQASMLFNLVKWCHSEGGQKSAIRYIVIKGDFWPPLQTVRAEALEHVSAKLTLSMIDYMLLNLPPCSPAL